MGLYLNGGTFFWPGVGVLSMLKDTGSRICDYGRIETMVGPETDAQFQFTGIKKYFNSYTLTSRMATYRDIALIVLWRSKKKQTKTPAGKATLMDSCKATCLYLIH